VHCLSCNADFYTFTVDGQTLAATLGAWFFGHVPVRQASKCTGWDCTLQCSGGPWMPTNTPCPTTTNICANTYMLPPPTRALPPGESAAVAGNIAWSQSQTAAHAAAAQTAGNVAWSQTGAPGGADPYAKEGPPMSAAQAAQAGNVAWSQQQAAQKAAAAKAAGNAAWSVNQAQAKAAGGGAAWAASQGQPGPMAGGQPYQWDREQQAQTQNSDWDATGVQTRAQDGRAPDPYAREGPPVSQAQAAEMGNQAYQEQLAAQRAARGNQAGAVGAGEPVLTPGQQAALRAGGRRLRAQRR